MADKIIDVSNWQGNIDWNKVKSDGVKAAILRAGYGRYESQKDKNSNATIPTQRPPVFQ